MARTHRVPIIPFGAGTSLEGHINAPRGGLSVDFSRMNRISRSTSATSTAVVEPGVSRKQLNDYLRDLGLFFPVDPGAEEATIGGMASTRASGTTALRYGTMRENVLNITAVMADGSVVKTAQRARKSAAGYDLTRLMVGAEGTLGVITELTVRLYGIPEKILSAVCPFQTLEGACNAVIQSIQLGLGVARMELVDATAIHAVNKYAKLALGGGADAVPRIPRHGGLRPRPGRDFPARSPKPKALSASTGPRRKRTAAGSGRRATMFYWAAKTTWPGKDTLATDICVPISRLAECVLETQADIKSLGLIAPIVGHVGDGNFHTQPMVDRSNPKEMAAVEAFLERLAERAIAMEGTCTGEHGIGQGKAKYLKAELGDGLGVMRAIKQALDPLDIMNPGKILPG